MRNMSFMFTTNQIRNRIKFVTRRLGWWTLKKEGGEQLCAVEKGQGLKKGEKIQRIDIIKTVKTNLEPLNIITPEEVILEGFPEKSPEWFIDMFCKANKCFPETIVNRIEFDYYTPVLNIPIGNKKICPECGAEIDTEHNRCKANCHSIEGDYYEQVKSEVTQIS